jgi:hypothetical protein
LTSQETVFFAVTITVTSKLTKYVCVKPQDIGMLIGMPHKAHLVAAIDPDKGIILDIRKKHVVRTVPKWNSGCTKDGRYGLYAPSR